jgi:hypothetical protein
VSKQYFGKVESKGHSLDAMLCQDIDRPMEYMVHVWGVGIAPMAVLFNGKQFDDGSFELAPRLRFNVTDKGAIYIADVPEADRVKFDTTRAHLTLGVDGAFSGSWTNGLGEGGSVHFALSPPVEINPTECQDWAAFVAWTNVMRKERNAGYFRGHGSNTFKLETTLQRNGYHRLDRYCVNTLSKFQRHAEAALNLHINMGDGNDYAMLLGLAQHFGLPTPLLDWSESPYIAAYFAFADALENRGSRPDVKKVRIFSLSQDFLDANRVDSVVLPYFKPYVSPLNISFRNNARLYAQQGGFTVTNHANMTGAIRELELSQDRKLLFAADLPVELVEEVLQDLAFMGLSGATLFPGLDGVSKMLKHEMAFGHPVSKAIGQPVQDPPALSITV